MRIKKLLLHICCSPCSIEVINTLSESGFEVHGYFYNPNIHPWDEYRKRRDSVIEYLEKNNIEYEIGDYDIYEYFKNIGSNFQGSKRCKKCYDFRLKKTASRAKELGYNNFCTTLLFNPHKDFKRIARIAEKIAEESNLNFVNPDLKRDYWRNKEEAKREGMYLQKYCGCVFSNLGLRLPNPS